MGAGQQVQLHGMLLPALHMQVKGCGCWWCFEGPCVLCWQFDQINIGRQQ
jgi:hypothetical protein